MTLGQFYRATHFAFHVWSLSIFFGLVYYANNGVDIEVLFINSCYALGAAYIIYFIWKAIKPN